MLGTDSPATQAVWRNYSLLTEKFGDEYTVLMDTPMEAMAAVVDAPLAQAIVKVRTGEAKVTPGYDGVYRQRVLGMPPLTVKPKPKPAQAIVKQTNMVDFFGK